MSDPPDNRSTTDPAPPDGSPAARIDAVEVGSTPEPGDPDYDAFLREVQRLADEREAAGVTSGTSTRMRTTVQLFALFFMATVGLAVVVAVGLGALGESEMRLGRGHRVRAARDERRLDLADRPIRARGVGLARPRSVTEPGSETGPLRNAPYVTAGAASGAC